MQGGMVELFLFFLMTFSSERNKKFAVEMLYCIKNAIFVMQ